MKNEIEELNSRLDEIITRYIERKMDINKYREILSECVFDEAYGDEWRDYDEFDLLSDAAEYYMDYCIDNLRDIRDEIINDWTIERKIKALGCDGYDSLYGYLDDRYDDIVDVGFLPSKVEEIINQIGDLIEEAKSKTQK